MRRFVCDSVAHLGGMLAAAMVGVTVSASSWAATVSYDIPLDVDNNAASGCVVTSPRGDFAGAELLLSTTAEISDTESTVTGVTLQRCVGGTFGAPQVISSSSWPVGTFARPLNDPVNVIETFVPLAAFGEGSRTIRAGLVANTPDGGDALFETSLFIQRAAAGIAPVPTLSPLSLALLAAGMGVAGTWLLRRHRASVMWVGACVLLSSVSAVWAATIVMDGLVSDWSGKQPRMSGPASSPNLAYLWFDHDATNAYFRIDACEQTAAVRGEIVQAADGQPIEYVTRSGVWTIKVDGHQVIATRSMRCQLSKVEMWGHPHENLNGKHIKDWLDDRRSLLLDDGTKITMHADGPQGVIHRMSIYDGANSIEFDNDNNIVLHNSTNADEARERDEAEADGETAYARFVPDDSPGAIGILEYSNIYTQDEPGVAPQCTTSAPDASCVNVPLGTTGDRYLNPTQVNDYYDDPRLGHT